MRMKTQPQLFSELPANFFEMGSSPAATNAVWRLSSTECCWIAVTAWALAPSFCACTKARAACCCCLPTSGPGSIVCSRATPNRSHSAGSWLSSGWAAITARQWPCSYASLLMDLQLDSFVYYAVCNVGFIWQRHHIIISKIELKVFETKRE